MNESGYIVIKIALKFVPRGPIDIKKALLQVIAWRRTGDKPLPELMLTQFTEAYIYAAPGVMVDSSSHCRIYALLNKVINHLDNSLSRLFSVSVTKMEYCIHGEYLAQYSGPVKALKAVDDM